jgi:hypothetical protein
MARRSRGFLDKAAVKALSSTEHPSAVRVIFSDEEGDRPLTTKIQRREEEDGETRQLEGSLQQNEDQVTELIAHIFPATR